MAQKQIHQASLWMKLDWLIDLCMSSEGQRDGQKETTECESGSGEGSRRYMDEAWPPDGGRRVLNQTEINGVWETERKKFRHMPADLNPFFSTNQYREMHVCVCVRLFGGREVLSVSLPIKIRNTVTLTRPCLTPQWPSNLCTCLYLILDPVIL